MRIAVTGATGFLGRYIVAALVDQGHTCRCWYRPDSDRSDFDAHAEQLEWIPGSLGDRKSAAELVTGCDALVHAALYRAGAAFRGGEGDVVDFVRTNVLGTLELIEEARAADVSRCVYIATCAVHEKILDDRPLDELHPLWPTTHYGAHKAALEKFVHSYGFGMAYPICSLRPSGIYGLAHPLDNTKWFDLVRRVVAGESVECRRGGKEVHAADVAQAIQLLLETDGAKIAGQAYSCCDLYVSDYEVAMLARQFSKSDAEIKGEKTAPKHKIVTEKLESLGMRFGRRPLLGGTIREMVAAIQNR
jgi:nucleoside-diphosphate-sugar epimerase